MGRAISGQICLLLERCARVLFAHTATLRQQAHQSPGSGSSKFEIARNNLCAELPIGLATHHQQPTGKRETPDCLRNRVFQSYAESDSTVLNSSSSECSQPWVSNVAANAHADELSPNAREAVMPTKTAARSLTLSVEAPLKHNASSGCRAIGFGRRFTSAMTST